MRRATKDEEIDRAQDIQVRFTSVATAGADLPQLQRAAEQATTEPSLRVYLEIPMSQQKSDSRMRVIENCF